MISLDFKSFLKSAGAKLSGAVKVISVPINSTTRKLSSAVGKVGKTAGATFRPVFGTISDVKDTLLHTLSSVTKKVGGSVENVAGTALTATKTLKLVTPVLVVGALVLAGFVGYEYVKPRF